MTGLLIWVSADPRTSHRANEAVREGLGFAASRIPVRFYLSGEAVRILADDPWEFVDGEAMEKHLQHLSKFGAVFHVSPARLASARGGPHTVSVEPSDEEALGKLLASSDRFIRY